MVITEQELQVGERKGRSSLCICLPTTWVYATLYHPGYTTLLCVRVAPGNGTQKGAIAHLLTFLVSSASGLTLA